MNIRHILRGKISGIDPDKVIIYSISLMMGVMFFDHTNALSAGCYFLAMAAWMFKWVREKRVLLEWDLVGIILLALLGNAFLSSLFSYDVKYSFREFRGEIAKMVPFYFLILSNIKTPRDIKVILKGLFAGAVVMSVIGVLGYFAGLTLYRERTVSVFANESYTSLGFYLLVTCCLLLGLLIHESDRKRIILYCLMIITCFSCILATLTRSVWLGFFSAVAAASFFYRKKLVLLFPAAALVFFLVFPAEFTGRLATILNFRDYTKPGGVLSDRFQLWQSAADMIRDHPFLGVGYGKRIFKKVYIREGYIRPEATERRPMPNAHNLYLDTAVQMGIPGLVIFLGMLAVFFRKTSAAYGKTAEPFLRGVLFGCLLGVFELLQVGLTGNLFFDENGLYIIFLLAAAAALQRVPSPSTAGAPARAHRRRQGFPAPPGKSEAR